MQAGKKVWELLKTEFSAFIFFFGCSMACSYDVLATSSNLNICFNFFQGLTFLHQLQPSTLVYIQISLLPFSVNCSHTVESCCSSCFKSVEKKTIKCALKLEQIVSESLHKIFMNIISHLVCSNFSSSFEEASESESEMKWKWSNLCCCWMSASMWSACETCGGRRVDKFK